MLPKEKLLPEEISGTPGRSGGGVSDGVEPAHAGSMVAAHPVIPVPLYCCQLERAKTNALRQGQLYETMVEIKAGRDKTGSLTKASQHNGRPLIIPQWDFIRV